ncbi:MAG TPA: SAM-dependent methyltransferase [Methylophilaceae bacterium]|jgi:SAM-dependent MidA family methyltransferase
MNSHLPIPDPDALTHSSQLVQVIRSEIAANRGWIDFARYMELALYAPGLGYYSGGAKKFGHDGDFVTAPEISRMFAQCLARQAGQVLEQVAGDVLELGAGTGKLAAELLLELECRGRLPERYLVLEVSAYLREIQRQTLMERLPSDLLQRVQWLDALPQRFTGIVVANEVLDALPVHVLKTGVDGVTELGVTAGADEETFAWSERPLQDAGLLQLLGGLDLPPDYVTECCPAMTGLLASLAAMLERGVLLFIDYGFPRHEYYHSQRSQGTLMCHYRHHAHADPFLHPGLQDITAHVDFTALAQAGTSQGLELKGYCGQAQFLINCGITDILGRVPPDDMARYLPLASEAQRLLSPAEMGELFKVMAFGRGCDFSLLGFVRGDRSHTL